MARYIGIALAVLIAAALTASAADAQPFVNELTAFLGNPSGASIMFVHGRTATGTGAAFNFRLGGEQSPAHLDLGIITSSRGSTRVVPGVSADLPVGKSPPVQPYLGLAITPSEYGGTHFGLFEADGVCVYGGLRRAW